jgi:outer membrane protein TolC
MLQPATTMRLFGTLLALVGGAAATSALADTTTNRNLSLNECVQIAIQHNFDVEIHRLNPELSRLSLRIAYAPYDPTFSISGEHDFNQSPGGIDAQGRRYSGVQTDDNQGSTSFSGLLPWGLNWSLGGGISDTWGTQPGVGKFETASASGGFGEGLQLSQPLLKNSWIDNTRLQIFLAKKTLKNSELDFRLQVMNSIFAVEQAYYNLIYAQDNVGVQKLALELAERLLAENKKRVEVGALAPLDEKQAESQVATSQAGVLSAESDRDTQQRALKNLLSDDYSQWQNTVIKPTEALLAIPETFNLQESWRRGMSLRPDLLQYKLTIEKQGFTIRYWKNQLLPEMDLFGDYGYQASVSSSTNGADMSAALDQLRGRDNPFWTVGARMNLPLGNINARHNYRSAKVTLEQANLQLKQFQQRILISIENDVAVAQTDFLRARATREARIYAAAALDAEQKKLDNGKSTSFTVLQLQSNLTTAQSAEIRALADYNIALAQLALDEGTTLERRHVALDVH